MLRNYLTSALRNLWKHKGYSFINIFGLSVAVASCLLLLFVVQVEIAYDAHHPDVERLHRVIRSTRMSDTDTRYTFETMGPLGPALEATFPDVEQAVRFVTLWGTMEHEAKAFPGRITITDPGVFDVFNLGIVVGDPEIVFGEPYGLFVTESTAKKFFGDEDPIGKTLKLDWLADEYVVGGVIRDPRRTQLSFDALTTTVPNVEWTIRHFETWRPLSNSRYTDTYIKLKQGADPAEFEAKLDQVVEIGMGGEWLEKIGYRLIPIKDVWLYAHQRFGIDRYGDIALLHAIGAIALSILVIACFNYINLATARSQSRALEVGLRKVVGAYRKQVAGQFFGESAFVTLVSACLGIMMARLFLPTFNGLIDKNVPFDILNPTVAFGLLAVLGSVALLSGLYPAIVLSSFEPNEVLKGSMIRTRRGIWLRRSLVIVQFGISVALGVGILVMDRQMVFVQTKDLGFARENIIGIFGPLRGRPDLRGRHPRTEVRKVFARHPSILASAVTRNYPGMRNPSSVIWIPEGPNRTEFRFPMMSIDEGFLETYDIPLVAGRNLSEDRETDATHTYILTESAARAFGWDRHSAIGKALESPIFETKDKRPRGHVIGVVRDFHLNPLHRQMQPIVLFMSERHLYSFSVRYRPGERDAAVEHIEKTWKRYQKSEPPRYEELDVMLERAYEPDRQLIKTSRVFGTIALVVACMGLMGLTAFTTRQRMKEIGVRKVLGGTTQGLVKLLTQEVAMLVILANVLAAPFGYWVAANWLESFQYHVEIGAANFAIVATVSLTIALVTVSYQTLSAVRTNPVDVLRDE